MRAANRVRATRPAAVRSGFPTSPLNQGTLFFLALFTRVVSAETPPLAKNVYVLTAVGVEFGWFALVAAFVTVGAVKRRFDAVAHRIGRAAGAVLVALGLRLALSSAGDRRRGRPGFAPRIYAADTPLKQRRGAALV